MCNPATCTNGKCNATGECVDKPMPPKMHTLPQREISPGVDMVLRQVPVRTIIAFTGLAGAGKSTAAAHLVKRHGFHRIRFAGPLKAMMAALGCTPEQIDGSEKETPCDLLGGKTPRHAMQTLGTEWGRDLITSDLWIRAWQAAVAKVPAGTPIVIDDCRFPNEAEAVRAAGGILVRIDRPGAGTASVHVSEAHQLEAVTTLRNVADEQYLRDLVDILVADLSWQERVA